MTMTTRTSDGKLQGDEIPRPVGKAADVIVSPDTLRDQRLPPGQSRTKKWPVLDAHGAPNIDLSKWSLSVTGLVEAPQCFTWNDFRQLPRVRVFSDFHCVTRWSRLGNLWSGVATRELLQRARPRAEARFVLVHGYDGSWTTNLPLDELLAEDALFADEHDGSPLPADHGGPVRLVVPRLYAWKSAKWVKAVELLAHDRAGYWERGGYHMHGDPWKQERYGW